MEAGLRASLDRDLATIAERQSTANRLIQAVAITQAEHTSKLETIINVLMGDVGVLKGDVGELKGDVGELKGQMTTVHGKLDRILAVTERN